MHLLRAKRGFHNPRVLQPEAAAPSTWSGIDAVSTQPLRVLIIRAFEAVSRAWGFPEVGRPAGASTAIDSGLSAHLKPIRPVHRPTVQCSSESLSSKDNRLPLKNGVVVRPPLKWRPVCVAGSLNACLDAAPFHPLVNQPGEKNAKQIDLCVGWGCGGRAFDLSLHRSMPPSAALCSALVWRVPVQFQLF